VLIGVLLRSVLVVLGGMQRMAVGYFGVMRGLLVIAGLGMFGGFAMMLGRMLVVLGGLFMMLVNLVLVHIVTVHRRLPVCICWQYRSIARTDEAIAT
jgi:hypothetical protein